jgi:hypothetical protein
MMTSPRLIELAKRAESNAPTRGSASHERPAPTMDGHGQRNGSVGFAESDAVGREDSSSRVSDVGHLNKGEAIDEGEIRACVAEHVRWCREERDGLAKSLVYYQTGILSIGERKIGEPMTAGTVTHIVFLQRQIKQLDNVIAAHAALPALGAGVA